MPPRSANRRSMPVSLARARATRTTRSTRSESRGADESGDARSSRATSAESAGLPTRRSKRRANGGKKQDLSAVAENQQDVAYPELPEAEEIVEDVDIPEHLEQASSFGGIPPSTIPQSQLEIEAIDGEKLVDALSSLHLLSTTLLEFFQVTSEEEMIELRDELKNVDKRAAKIFRGQRERFRRELKGFRPSGLFIDLSVAIRAMLHAKRWTDVGDGGWRADAILHLANIAELLCGLVPASREDRDAQNYLTTLLLDFPTSFLSDLSKQVSKLGDSALIQETLLLGFELRVQCLICWLSEEKSTSFTVRDADNVLNDMFYIPETGDVLRGFPPEGKEGYNSWALRNANDALPTQYQSAVADIMNRITQYWSSSDIDVAGLDSEFPWTDFLYKLCSWAQQRIAELSDRIARHGADAIRRSIKDRLTNARPRTTGSNISARDRQSWIMQMRRQSALSSSANPKAAEATTHAAFKQNANGDRQPNQSSPADENPFQAPPSAQIQQSPRQRKPEPSQQQKKVTQEFLIQYGAEKKQGNKENIPNATMMPPKKRFIDAQPGARQVSPSNSGEETPPPRYTNKRKRQQEEEQSDNDDFEEDQRDEGKGGKRRAAAVETSKKVTKAPAIAQRPAGRKEGPAQNHDPKQVPESIASDDAHFIVPPGGDDDDRSESHDSVANQLQAALSASESANRASSSRPRGASQISNRSQTMNGTQDSPPVSTARSEAEVYAVANGIANLERRLASVPKVQQRRPWDADETTRLIQLIEEHGCSWSMLKRIDQDHEDGPRLESRDQVALKDKARNMKMDYLQGFVTLPHNFDRIPLKRTEKERLAQRGIPENGSAARHEVLRS